MADLRDQLGAQKETLSRNSGASGPDASLARMGDRVSQVEEITELVERDSFDVTLWPVLRSFYTKHSLPTRNDIREFIQFYDEDIGKLL